MKKVINALLVVVICFLVATLISNIFLLNVVVSGSSMESTLNSGDFGLADKQIWKLNGIKRFDIVVVNNDDNLIVKRVVGLPNEKLEYKNGVLKINDKIIEEDYLKDNIRLNDDLSIILGNDEYFVMGDNRDVSLDSRRLGPIKEKNIEGKLFVIFGSCKSDIVCDDDSCDCLREYHIPIFY